MHRGSESAKVLLQQSLNDEAEEWTSPRGVEGSLRNPDS